jgi:biopolymer transport protein ExbD
MTASASNQTFSNPMADDGDSLTPLRKPGEEARFDITAMIDLVFMMNIFFLVTTVGAALTEIDLPNAQHCVAADPETATILTIVGNREPGSLQVFIADGTDGTPLTERDEQDREIRLAVEDGLRQNKTIVLIKAERSVRLRDMARIAAAATAVPNTELRVAVSETKD